MWIICLAAEDSHEMSTYFFKKWKKKVVCCSLIGTLRVKGGIVNMTFKVQFVFVADDSLRIFYPEKIVLDISYE